MILFPMANSTRVPPLSWAMHCYGQSSMLSWKRRFIALETLQRWSQIRPYYLPSAQCVRVKRGRHSFCSLEVRDKGYRVFP